MENTKTKDEKKQNYEILKELFDKQLELEKLKQKKNPTWKIITYIFVGIASVGFLAFSCYMMYKQSFTMETLLAVLLSFFSIALSIMFYIQSEKSSSNYYMHSYEIMKDVSVALGKIEASFGEKLTDIKANIAKIENQKVEMENKLEQGEKEENEIKNKITKQKLTEEEKIKLLNELQEKTRENEFLRRRLDRIESMRRRAVEENSIIKEKMQSQENMIQNIMTDKKIRNYLMHNKHDIEDEII